MKNSQEIPELRRTNKQDFLYVIEEVYKLFTKNFNGTSTRLLEETKAITAAIENVFINILRPSIALANTQGILKMALKFMENQQKKSILEPNINFRLRNSI